MSANPELVSKSTVALDVGRATILIVDDRPDKLLVFKTILEDLDQNIVTLQSGEAALRWLLDNECAVMLLDVNMPGMDGFETAQLIRGRRKTAHTPIIFITAHADEIRLEKGYSLGAVDYMLSPAVPSILRSKVMVFVQLFNLTLQIKRQADEHVNLAREQAARAAAEELTRRASFLADASKILSSSLDVSSLMVGATRLVVPTLADFSAITLVDGDGTLVRTACRRDLNLDEARMSIIQVPFWLAATNEVIATGQLKIIEDFSAQAVSHGNYDAANERNANNGWPLQQVAMLPLIARDKTHGVLTLAWVPSGRHFTTAELDLATDIASRVAVAMDNCLLFQEIQKGDRRKNEFLATLSHELRNPLAPMRNAIHALHLSGQWPAGANELREMFDRQLGHLTHLVNDLLDVARISQGKIQLRKERVDLIVEINHALKSCRAAADSAGHRLTVSLPETPVIMEGDRVRLQQIFENLLFNACKYTEPNGRIDVSLTSDEDRAVITIRDTGVGIASEMMPKIWDIFAQVDANPERVRQGLGIGLSLVKKLVTLHGGSIDATSEGLGKGSAFVVRLPILTIASQIGASQAPPSAKTVAVNSDNLPARRILVVDDNVDAAESLQVLLTVFGHSVEIAHEGVTALQVAWAFKPDLVFLDIGLPGMNGYEVARRLRDEGGMKTEKLIALSGYGTEKDHILSKEAGFDRHLVKPVDPSALPTIIATAFSEN